MITINIAEALKRLKITHISQFIFRRTACRAYIKSSIYKENICDQHDSVRVLLLPRPRITDTGPSKQKYINSISCHI